MKYLIIDTFEEDSLENVYASFDTLEDAKAELKIILDDEAEQNRYIITDKFGNVVS